MVPNILEEFADISLGDARLNRRLGSIVSNWAEDPSRSLPQSLGAAELEACYRFLDNESVEVGALLGPHIGCTVERSRAHGAILMVHDTTEFRFGGARKQLPLLQDGQKGHGFNAHVALAVSADSRREALGVVAIDTWNHGDVDASGVPKNERDRWLAQSLATEALFVGGAALIHVEDREGDISSSLETRKAKGIRFVVRAQHQHVVMVNEDRVNLGEYVRTLPRRQTVEVTLSARAGTASAKAVKMKRGSPAPREGRKVTLAIAGGPINLRVSRTQAKVRAIDINVVHVIELDPPEGEQVVEWILLTSEPVDALSQLEQVIDFYRARWVIEEYFKVLKTGCTYESLQLETQPRLERALRLYAVIAWRLLWLRFAAHHLTDQRVEACEETVVLKAKGFLATQAPTINEFFTALAKLGGHLKHNGAPGWIVLWRGYAKLRLLIEGMQLRSDQS